MATQVSNCYYHPERGSVAVCAKCGVGICKDCAVKDGHGRVLCYQCENEILKQEHKEYRKWLKENGGRFRNGKEFIVPGIIGFLMIIAAGVLAYFGCFGYFDFRMFSGQIGLLIAACLFVAYLLFSTPFCYIVLSDFFASKCDTIWGVCLKCYLKFWISLLFGWIVFTFLWIRFFVRKARSKHNQAKRVDNP